MKNSPKKLYFCENIEMRLKSFCIFQIKETDQERPFVFSIESLSFNWKRFNNSFSFSKEEISGHEKVKKLQQDLILKLLSTWEGWLDFSFFIFSVDQYDCWSHVRWEPWRSFFLMNLINYRFFCNESKLEIMIDRKMRSHFFEFLSFILQLIFFAVDCDSFDCNNFLAIMVETYFFIKKLFEVRIFFDDSYLFITLRQYF